MRLNLTRPRLTACRVRAAAGVVALALLTSSCADGAPGPQVPSTSRTAGSSPALPRPVEVSVVRELERATMSMSGTFEETTIEDTMTGSQGSATATKVVSGTFDGPTGHRDEKLVQKLVTTGGQPQSIEGEFRVINGSLYLAMAGWPVQYRGTWLRYSLRDLAAAATQSNASVGGFNTKEPSSLLALITHAVGPGTVTDANGAAKTYVVQVPGNVALRAFGASVEKALVGTGHSVDELTGTVPVTVHTPDGRTIDLVKLDGSVLLRQVATWIGAPGMSGSVTLAISGLGTQFTVTAPPDTEVRTCPGSSGC